MQARGGRRETGRKRERERDMEGKPVELRRSVGLTCVASEVKQRETNK